MIRNFHALYYHLKKQLLTDSYEVHTERWQGLDISKKPDMVSYELLNVECTVPLLTEDLDHWRRDISPNLPWADDHFLERVGGEPLNPGKEWANWPWATSADRFREDQKFNHTYMERLWPRYAGMSDGGKLEQPSQAFHPKEPFARDSGGAPAEPRQGIRIQYGDLDSLVDLLAHEPLTRQAYIPLFFPEDTGYGDGGRKPCTLGYQFIMRDGKFHLYYPIRSCDFIRHFRDDCYLAVRLLLWVLDRCRERNEVWNAVKPGTYTMHCTSLHIFRNDWLTLYGKHR